MNDFPYSFSFRRNPWQEDWTALHAAADKGHLEVVKVLLASGADADAKGKARDEGDTRLHARLAGALRQKLPAPRALQHGRTAIHAAAEKGHLEVVHALLGANATMTCQDKDGRTPLHKACERGSLQVAAALLEAGADTAATDAVRFWFVVFFLCSVRAPLCR
jgi:ankyrin repeat protein